MTATVADQLAETLAAVGVKRIYGIVGDSLSGPTDAIRMLPARWDDATMDALLLLVPLAQAHNHGGQGDFHLAPDGRITKRRQPGRPAPFVYTGVQILSPRVIADWPEGPFSTNLFWDRTIAAGRAYGLVHQGLWFDVGTPAAIGKTEAILADG